MKQPQLIFRCTLLVALCCFSVLATAQAQESVNVLTEDQADTAAPSGLTDADSPEKSAEEPVTQSLLVNDRRLRLKVPAAWKVVEPRNRLIEFELAILPNDGEEKPANPTEPPSDVPEQRGRLTMMAAGGDVESNIRRWIGQFRLGRDGDGKDAMRRDERKLRRAVAHVLDIAGTYFDSPQGPFGPKVELTDYRMLAAIIDIDGAGKYFIKFYGPATIVEENREAFEEMLASLEFVDTAAEENPSTNNESEQPTVPEAVDS